MEKTSQIDIKIDKLTRSIENAISGDSFKTNVLKLTINDIKKIKKADWLFDLQKEIESKDKAVYKLIIHENIDIIQGLISVQDKGDHIFMHLLESNKFNRGIRKIYLGVPGNLVAFACKLSFDKGYAGYISFESKSGLINHYKKTLNAHILFKNFMAIDTIAAIKLVNQYFPKNS